MANGNDFVGALSNNVALQQRARAHKAAFQRANPGVPTGIPGVGDDMDAVFQAESEASGGKPIKMQGGQGPAYSNQFVGTSTQPGGSMASRPSLQALRTGGGVGYGEDASGFYSSAHDNALRATELAQEGDYARMHSPGYIADQQDDAEMEARLAPIRQADAARASAAADIGTGAAAARGQSQAEIAAAAAKTAAVGSANTYFDPAVERQRKDEMYNRMEELRRRYSDPAILKGQAALAEAATRGQYGVQREVTRGQFGLENRTLENQGNEDVAGTRARASVGAATAGAGGDASRYVQPLTGGGRGAAVNMPGGAGGGAASTMEMSQDELNAFARDNNLDPRDALKLAQQLKYTVR